MVQNLKILKQPIFEASVVLQKIKGTKKIKKTSFHQYSWNSEVETTWISLIGWPHKTSTRYYLNDLNITLASIFHLSNLSSSRALWDIFSWVVTYWYHRFIQIEMLWKFTGQCIVSSKPFSFINHSSFFSSCFFLVSL